MTPSGPSHTSERRFRHSSDRIWGLVVLAGAFAGALLLSAWAHHVVEGASAGPSLPAAEDLVGWPRSVDPVQALKPARRLANRSHLAGLVASGVRVDGLLDAHGSGRVRYTFQSPPGSGPHVRGMTKDERARACGKQTVRLGPAGLAAAADDPDHSCPNPAPQPLPDPRCGPRELWALALAKGASGTALGRAEYYRAVKGPAWSFRVGRVNFTVDESCRRELAAADARRRSH